MINLTEEISKYNTNVSAIVKTKSVLELCDIIERKEKVEAVKTIRGQKGGIYVHPVVYKFILMNLSPEFRYEILRKS
jgi:hypothetical protein